MNLIILYFLRSSFCPCTNVGDHVIHFVLFALQIGINKLANVVSMNLEQNGRNVVLMSKCGSLKNMNDGIIIAKEERNGIASPCVLMCKKMFMFYYMYLKKFHPCCQHTNVDVGVGS